MSKTQTRAGKPNSLILTNYGYLVIFGDFHSTVSTVAGITKEIHAVYTPSSSRELFVAAATQD